MSKIIIVSTEDIPGVTDSHNDKKLYTLIAGTTGCNTVKHNISENNIIGGKICDNEIKKLIGSTIDIIIKIKEIPKFVKKYNNQIKIINDNVKVIEKYNNIVKEPSPDQIKFLKSDDSILYINPFNKDKENYWRVMDFNLPLIDTYDGLSDCIKSFVSECKGIAATATTINFTNEIFPNNIGQLLVHKIKSLNLKADRKTKEGELLESLKKFKIPFVCKDKKIIKDTSDLNIIELLKHNIGLVDDIYDEPDLNTYAEYYNILGLYLYNTCNIYIEFLLYCINKLLELVDNKTVLYLYLSKYTISLNRLKVIVRNSFYNLFPPKRATTKYNIQLTDKKVGVIEDVYFADKDIVKTIYSGANINNIGYALFLKGTDKIYDAYDSTMILSIGGFEIKPIESIESFNKLVLTFNRIPDDLNRINDKNTIETNIKIVNRFIKYLKEGLDSVTREKIKEKINGMPATLSILKSLYEDNMKRSLDYSLFIVNFETNMLNRNYNAKAKLIESLDEAKIFARYYNNVAKYILINTEKKSSSLPTLMKDFIIPCKKIEEEVRKRLEDKIRSIQTKVVNIRSNNIKTFNVTNYKEDEFWNRLQAIVYGNDFYIPIERSKEIYLLPVIETAKRGKISDDKLVSEAKYFYSKFKDNILYLVESKAQFSTNSSLRYLPNSFYEELYDSNDNKVKRLLFEVLNSPSKYMSSTEKFNSNNSFVNRLLKYNNDLGFKSLSDNNRQIVTQNQIRAMIKSIM